MTARRAGAARLAAALLAGLAARGAAQVPAGWSEWPMPGRTYDNQRFSPLADITRANVKSLAAAWEVSTGSLGAQQGSPLVVGSTLYLRTPAPARVVALDLAKPGAPILWRFSDPDSSPPGLGAPPSGLSYHGSGKLVLVLPNGDLAALDAKTGHLLWRVPQHDVAPLAPPLVLRDVVVVGVGEGTPRGRITAYDVGTGAERWRAYTSGPDSEVGLRGPASAYYPSMRGADLGATTWGAGDWRRGGAATGGAFAYDPDLDLLYYGSGAPAPADPAQRPGDDKWSMTVWARTGASGAVRWAYQTTPHDEWSYAGTNEMVLADMLIAGTPVKALVHFDQNGFAYTFDRTNGKLLVAEPFGAVTWARAIDLTSGLPTLDAPYATSAAASTAGVCPAAIGLKTQAPAAYSPETGWFYVPATDACMDYRAAGGPATPFAGALAAMYPATGHSHGRLLAWDATTGKTKWERPDPYALLGGALTTGGGLVFYGTLDGWFAALDQRSGAELWRFKAPSGIVSAPISFAGPDGRQEVAVVCGASATLLGLDSSATAAALGDAAAQTNPGGVLLVFALPVAAKVTH